MPTYDYTCTSCERESSATQSIKEEPLRLCPHCGELTLKRLVSTGTTFTLKGGGWASEGYSG